MSKFSQRYGYVPLEQGSKVARMKCNEIREWFITGTGGTGLIIIDIFIAHLIGSQRQLLNTVPLGHCGAGVGIPPGIESTHIH